MCAASRERKEGTGTCPSGCEPGAVRGRPPTCEYRPISGSFQAVRRLSDRSLSSMDRPNNQRSMVFRCEAARKASETRPRRSRRSAILSRFRDAAIRDAWRGPRIIAGARRKRAVQRGAQRRPARRKIPEASARKAERYDCRVRVCAASCAVSSDFWLFPRFSYLTLVMS